MLKATITVTLKPDVLDPQGKAIETTLHGLGFSEVGPVRQGKVIHMDLTETNTETARARLDEMCRRLLANTVIEDYAIILDSDAE